MALHLSASTYPAGLDPVLEIWFIPILVIPLALAAILWFLKRRSLLNRTFLFWATVPLPLGYISTFAATSQKIPFTTWNLGVGLIGLCVASILSIRSGLGFLKTTTLGLWCAGLSTLQLAPSLTFRATAGTALLVGAAAWLVFRSEPISVLLQPAAEPPDLPREETQWDRQRRKLVRWLEMVPIPAGSFLMGDPGHAVRVSGFDCLRHPVTRELYAAVMGNDPGRPKDANERPANNVSWWDAIAFCNRLSELEGRTTCYEKLSESTVVWHHEADGYRLPTEAEWEYACRAGTQTRWSFGDEEDNLGEHAWYEANAGGKPQSVGRKKPNPWGLHDLHGNVWEWCWDWYGSNPETEETATDPEGPPAGEYRSLRGGSFDLPAWDLRSAGRGGVRPEDWGWDIGFRCVLNPRRQP